MPPYFATPDEAENAYYQAFHQADIEAMMDVWEDSDEIVCIHPIEARQFVGTIPVMEGWLGVFARSFDKVIELHPVSKTVTGDMAVHVLQEHVTDPIDRSLEGIITVTNIYRRDPKNPDDGWKMILHQATHGPEVNVKQQTEHKSSAQLH